MKNVILISFVVSTSVAADMYCDMNTKPEAVHDDK